MKLPPFLSNRRLFALCALFTALAGLFPVSGVMAAFQPRPALQGTATPPLVACNGNEMEPNDGDWGCVIPKNQNFQGEIATATDTDTFLFAASAGQWYRADVTPAGGLDPRLTILDMAGNIIAQNDDLAPGNPIPQVYFAAPSTDYLVVRVQAQSVITGTYFLSVRDDPATPTPTATALPPTATATATPLPANSYVPCNGSENEPNEVWGCVLATDIPLPATFSSVSDVDTFLFWGKANFSYRIEALPVGGVDPRLEVWDLYGNLIAQNDDRAQSNPAPMVYLQIGSDGYYMVKVKPQTVFTGAYSVIVRNDPATPVPTGSPVPSPTASPAQPGATVEPNNDWQNATHLLPGETMNDSIGWTDMVDWWSLKVEAGQRYRCVIDSKAFDPKARVEMEGQILAENDDYVPGGITAIVEWTAPVEGLSFIVVEPVVRVGAYTILCSTATAAKTTPSAGSGGDGGGSTGSGGTPVYVPGTTPLGGGQPLSWYLIGPLAQPTPPVTTLHLLIYYDLNNNRAYDPTEGVKGLSIRALSGGNFVGWAMTDANGEASMVLTTPVDRITVPFLNLLQSVTQGQKNEFSFALQAVGLPVFFPVAEEEGNN